MALTLLGNNPINVGDGWVGYDPIALQNDRKYLLEIETQSIQPDFIYSRFEIRFLYPTTNSSVSASLDHIEFYYEPIRQNCEVKLSSLLATSGDVRFFVRRFPFYSQPSTLSSCNVLLGLDPTVFE